MSYDFIDQNIVASCLIQGHTDDSFYNPTTNSHTGYAFDGNYYSLGAVVNGHQKASWFTEFGTNPYRGDQAAFPAYGLVLLSPVSLVILDQAISVTNANQLPLWMQFLLGDSNALTNNFNGSEQGFLPSSVCYADGVVSVTYSPDAGNQEYFDHITDAPDWSSVTTYVLNQTVSLSGAVYISLANGNLDNNPATSPVFWTLYPAIQMIPVPPPTPYPAVS